MEDKRKDPKEKKCAVCGKDMYAGEEWAYKRRDGKGKTKWFCSYKCMRAYDAKHDGKNAAVVTVDEVAAAPKEPVSRAVLAKALAKEIKNGGSVIAYLTAEGYKNPYEAYNSVRHYCETKMPELAEVLKPLRDLPKGPQKKTGRPRKYPATVEKVDEVPEVEPVQCIAHVTPTDIEEAEEAVADLLLQGGVNYQLKIDEAKTPEVAPGFDLEITAVRHKNYGEFYRDHDHNCIDWRTPGGDEMSLSVDAWKKLIRDLPEIIRQLGVEV